MSSRHSSSSRGYAWLPMVGSRWHLVSGMSRKFYPAILFLITPIYQVFELITNFHLFDSSFRPTRSLFCYCTLAEYGWVPRIVPSALSRSMQSSRWIFWWRRSILILSCSSGYWRHLFNERFTSPGHWFYANQPWRNSLRSWYRASGWRTRCSRIHASMSSSGSRFASECAATVER